MRTMAFSVLVASNAFILLAGISAAADIGTAAPGPRARISIDDGWRFYRYPESEKPDNLIYDVRPAIKQQDYTVADAKPTEAVKATTQQAILKSWVLPTGNDFISQPDKRYARPKGDPGADFPFVQVSFDDSGWDKVNLPHDWAIAGPFYTGGNPKVGGGMGRLPIQGVAWYRRQLDIPVADAGKSVFLDIDGAMSYAMVWLNGHLVGGWPYGYNSFRLNLTPYIAPGSRNELAIRLDNPLQSARWYPGAGIYRNVWLVKTQPIHVGQWGTYVKTPKVSKDAAEIELDVTLDNDSKTDATATVSSEIYELNSDGRRTGPAIANIAPAAAPLPAGARVTVKGSATIAHPKLWGPPPTQTPNRYVAITTVTAGNKLVDIYETPFGIRDVRFDPAQGALVNGERIVLKGVNLHHDLGALGAAFNARAAERQLQSLREMGCNAIRFSHNPPAPEFLEITDRLGFVVIDEIFDAWERKKPELDFHLIFPDWAEQDLRAMLRRDRNHPSVILWSFGNEVGEQYTGATGAAVAERLHDIAQDEEPTRPTILAMNYAKPDMPMPAVPEVIGLNYQGEGIRWDGVYSDLKGIKTPPQYDLFHAKFTNKVIISTENASSFSSRGVYLFPVFPGNSAPARDDQGGDSKHAQISAYELYTADPGSSADKVFAAEDQHPFIAGGFVWSGWDYLGEPSPYYAARSSYYGIFDLAGFKKDRFYLYQSRWRPDLPMAHILPHWTWPDRIGQVTPVHVFTSGDEAELFLNGQSLGRKKKGKYEYRLRWDDVTYQPGELKVIAYKNGNHWAEDTMKTAGPPATLELAIDRPIIQADGTDLAFVTARITDASGLTAPRADNPITFRLEGTADIIATDNGDPTDFTPFPSPDRKAFNGLALAIIRAKPGHAGTIHLQAQSPSLQDAALTLQARATGEQP